MCYLKIKIYERLKECQKEYEAYMKQVTDAFVDMQSDKIKGTIGHDKDRFFMKLCGMVD